MVFSLILQPKVTVAVVVASLIPVSAVWQHHHVQSRLAEQEANGDQQYQSTHQAVADKMVGFRQMFIEDPAGTLKQLSVVLTKQREVVENLLRVLPDTNATATQQAIPVTQNMSADNTNTTATRQAIPATQNATAENVSTPPSATTGTFDPLLDVDYILDADNYLEDFINASNIPLDVAPASPSVIKAALKIAAGQGAATTMPPAVPSKAVSHPAAADNQTVAADNRTAAVAADNRTAAVLVTSEMSKLMDANTKLAAKVEFALKKLGHSSL